MTSGQVPLRAREKLSFTKQLAIVRSHSGIVSATALSHACPKTPTLHSTLPSYMQAR